LLLRIIIDSKGCWIWQGAKTEGGYGHLYVDGYTQLAHRVMWTVVVGSIPDGMLICHTCDNPPCINPEHLFMGTVSANSRDMVQKGRGRGASRPGEKNPNHKISNDTVLRIRQMFQEGMKPQKIADLLGLNNDHVSSITRGDRWSYDKRGLDNEQ
jgi:HNH endonuclease